MQEEEVKNVVSSEETKVNDRDANYLDTIKKLKENSVAKEDYDKVVADNKRLLDNYINSTPVEADTKKEIVDMKALAKELGDPNLSNIDYAKKVLKLRDACIEQKHYDPFVGTNKLTPPTQDDYASAERVASVLQDCVEYADGDNQLFTQELQRRTMDIAIPKKKKF